MCGKNEYLYTSGTDKFLSCCSNGCWCWNVISIGTWAWWCKILEKKESWKVSINERYLYDFLFLPVELIYITAVTLYMGLSRQNQSPQNGPTGLILAKKTWQKWSPGPLLLPKSVWPDQFWQPKLAPLANFGPPCQFWSPRGTDFGKKSSAKISPPSLLFPIVATL